MTAKQLLLFIVGMLAAVAGGFTYRAYFAASPLEFFLPTRALQREFKTGFEEYSPEFAKWSAAWVSGSREGRRKAGAAVIVEYGSKSEIDSLYRIRAATYAEVANNEQLNGICTGEFGNSETLLARPEFLTVARFTGRAFARKHRRLDPWEAPVSLDDDAALLPLVKYLDDIGQANILRDIARAYSGPKFDFLPADLKKSNANFTRRMVCTSMASLYGLAASRGKDSVGTTTLFDFIRSMDLYSATQAMSAATP